MLPLMRLAILLSAVNWLIPLVWTLGAPASPYWSLVSTSPHAAAACVAYYVLSAVPSLLFFVLVFTFLSIAITDALRRRTEAARLGAILRHSDLPMPAHHHAHHASSALSEGSRANSINAKQQQPSQQHHRTARLHALTHPASRDKATKIAKRQSRFVSHDLSSESAVALVPRIPLSQPSSRAGLLCWLLARTVLRTFGARYKFRLGAWLRFFDVFFYAALL